MSKLKNLISHKTKIQVLIKFLAVFAIFIAYFIYLNFKFSFEDGILIALITWSFFVLATPIADAGFLLDFPLRIILGVRMFISEIFVWLFAILINIFSLFFYPKIYNSTFLTSLFQKIIINPYPYWLIIILSGIGTFLSIIIGDELIDVISHKDRILHHKHGFKLEILTFVVVLSLVIIGYYHIIHTLGIEIKQIIK